MRFSLFLVFPAPAGMNRMPPRVVSSKDRVPRTRGDEPFGNSELITALWCSPHPRG